MFCDLFDFFEAKPEHDVVDGSGDERQRKHDGGEHVILLEDVRYAHDVLKNEERLYQLSPHVFEVGGDLHLVLASPVLFALGLLLILS